MVYQLASKACAAASNHNSTKKGSQTVMTVQLHRAVLLLSLALFAVSAALARETPAVGGRATITVTAIGKKDSTPPSISKDDVQLSVGKERKQVAGWNKGDSLALAILIDDALDSSVGSQMSDLKSFIAA